MLDTGCSTIIVKDSLVNSKYKLGKMVKVYDYLGRPNYFPKIRCFIKSKFFTGWANAIAAPIKFAEVLIGCVPGVKIPNQSCPEDPSPATSDVATLTSCVSPDPCKPPEDPDLCDLPKPPSCDLTNFPDKPTFPFYTGSKQPFCCACDTWGPKTKNCSAYALRPFFIKQYFKCLSSM
ncbi:uncharacterized protein LOC125026006 [Penaeus chinensis]|uniref:uncharacterized protein LOC125026006 n=1 Tax=Penaeus chinensis TaxID=139456 RepID=UPI001FB5ED61|nr:uncharacterized protein LOC125026006 [Penaeus chinensis]